MDTEYTKGFKSGLAFREEQIIKLLEATEISETHAECFAKDCWCPHIVGLIALIKGEK